MPTFGCGLKSTQYKKLAPNNLQFTCKNLNSCKPHEKKAKSIGEKLKTKGRMFFVSFFSNFNMWTAKHLGKASCTEVTLRTSTPNFFHDYGPLYCAEPEIFKHACTLFNSVHCAFKVLLLYVALALIVTRKPNLRLVCASVRARTTPGNKVKGYS